MQATEFTEDTEMMRVLRIFPDYRMGEGDIYASRLFCELGDKPPVPAYPVSSVNSVFSVANCFF